MNTGIIFYRHNQAPIVNIALYNVTQGAFVFDDLQIDLFINEFNYSLGQFEQYVAWWELPNVTDDYEYVIDIMGVNPNVANGILQLLGFVVDQPVKSQNDYTRTLIARHTDYDTTYTYSLEDPDVDEIQTGPTYFYDIDNPEIRETGLPTVKLGTLAKITKHDGDGLIDTFEGAPAIEASRFLSYSVDAGKTWVPIYENDYSMTWGSNDPDYNDSIITAGNFKVIFNYPPPPGINNVQFKVLPLINKIRVRHNFIQCRDYDNRLVKVGEHKLIQYNLEMIP